MTGLIQFFGVITLMVLGAGLVIFFIGCVVQLYAATEHINSLEKRVSNIYARVEDLRQECIQDFNRNLEMRKRLDASELKKSKGRR